ncbi:MAG: adenylate/guanylate cyclase domain-containing protein, partial [Cyanobacteriota bacterium]
MKPELKINPLTLQFPHELELSFFEEYFQLSLSQVRFALLLAIFFDATSGILDQWISPDIRIKVLLLRYGLICPLLIAFFLFTFSDLFKRFMQVTISLIVLIVALSFIGFSLIIRNLHLDIAGIIIIILYTYTAIKLNFVYATCVGWTILGFYNLTISFIPPPLPTLVENNFHLVLANLLGMFANYLMEYYIRKDFIKDRLLAEERDKVEKLLLNILPQTIAERLKQEQSTIADNFAEVTIMFADIVDFTPLSARLSATEIVNLLNQIFSAFDQLAERHNLEKIKTIGDAYMVVGGLPTPRPDHAELVAEMALDMQQVIAKFSQELDESFSIRIGINTGPVVAGVIGLKKFIYDLWGDAVNTASRMESHGLASCIQVSQTTYDLLRDKYLFEERGVINVKGKGEMFTYLLRGRKVI